MVVSSQMNALIAHAIGAPVVFGLISLFYFRRFGYTTPLQTALIFLAFVFLMDFFVMAFAILKSFEMFTSVLGTWIPFVLIFLSTYATGLCMTKI
jgi:transcriptional regulator of nitric oxide reductase